MLTNNSHHDVLLVPEMPEMQCDLMLPQAPVLPGHKSMPCTLSWN